MDEKLLDDIVYSMTWMIKTIDYYNKLSNPVEETKDMKRAKETLEKLKGLKDASGN